MSEPEPAPPPSPHALPPVQGLSRKDFSLQASMGVILGLLVTLGGPLLIAMTPLPTGIGLALIALLTIAMCFFAWRLRRNPLKRGWSVGILISSALGGLLAGACYMMLASIEEGLSS